MGKINLLQLLGIVCLFGSIIAGIVINTTGAWIGFGVLAAAGAAAWYIGVKTEK